jgi:hypothetical protein
MIFVLYFKTNELMKPQLLFLTAIFFTASCEWDSVNTSDEEWVNVTYVAPVYKTASSLVDQVVVEEPKEQTSLGKIITYQNYVFVNEPMEGIHIVDHTDPSNPTNLSFLSIPGNLDMSIVDDHLYVDMFSSLAVFDIRDVLSRELKETYTVENVFDYDAFWNFPIEIWEEPNSYIEYQAYPDKTKGIVVDWQTETIREKRSLHDYRYNSDVAIPDVALTSEDGNIDGAQQTSTAGSMTRFLPIDGYLYTINFNELVLFQIGNDYRPIPWIKKNTQTQAETLFQLNDLLFVGSVNGMLVYDVSDAADPNYINRIEHMRSCDPVVADSNYAYVTLRGGTNCFTDINELQIIDIQDPQNLSVVSRKDMYNPHGLGVYNDHLIICDGTAGIKIVDVSTPTEPNIVNNAPIQFAYDVIIDYPHALIVGDLSLYQYDISNLPEMQLISQTQILDN